MAQQLTLDDFRSALERSKSQLLTRLEKQLKISALRMEGRSKDRTFSRFDNQTGRLRQSIAGNAGIFQGRPAAFLQAGGQFRGADVNYAKFIEFGTRYIRPRLFLGRSVEAEKEKLIPEIRKVVTAVLLGGRDG
tara:strand:- start:1140 stop:1541 length:402 start_codon:yes stop_codon:yes gene_type:complete